MHRYPLFIISTTATTTLTTSHAGVVNASCAPLNNMLVLLVGGLPIAMPTILSVTMALGASALAKKKAIVSRLTAVEEIAG